jgi:hypothetical protein
MRGSCTLGEKKTWRCAWFDRVLSNDADELTALLSNETASIDTLMSIRVKCCQKLPYQKLSKDANCCQILANTVLSNQVKWCKQMHKTCTIVHWHLKFTCEIQPIHANLLTWFDRNWHSPSLLLLPNLVHFFLWLLLLPLCPCYLHDYNYYYHHTRMPCLKSCGGGHGGGSGSISSGSRYYHGYVQVLVVARS